MVANPGRCGDDGHTAEVSIAEAECQRDEQRPGLVGEEGTTAWSGAQHHQRYKQQPGNAAGDQTTVWPVVLDRRDYLHQLFHTLRLTGSYNFQVA